MDNFKKFITFIINFSIVLIVGTIIQEKTMDALYPNRPKGIINNWFYKMEDIKK